MGLALGGLVVEEGGRFLARRVRTNHHVDSLRLLHQSNRYYYAHHNPTQQYPTLLNISPVSPMAEPKYSDKQEGGSSRCSALFSHEAVEESGQLGEDACEGHAVVDQSERTEEGFRNEVEGTEGVKSEEDDVFDPWVSE